MAIKNQCAGMESKLADLLLDPVSTPARVQSHVEACSHCRAELAELRATMELLGQWEAPEPNPYFMTRLNARMREERQNARTGWFARLRDRIAYGQGAHVRPLAAMSLTIMLLVGGGTYMGIANWDQPPQAPGQTAVVHDLQTLDNNAQLLDQLEALSTTETSGD